MRTFKLRTLQPGDGGHLLDEPPIHPRVGRRLVQEAEIDGCAGPRPIRRPSRSEPFSVGLDDLDPSTRAYVSYPADKLARGGYWSAREAGATDAMARKAGAALVLVFHGGLTLTAASRVIGTHATTLRTTLKDGIGDPREWDGGLLCSPIPKAAP